MPELEWWMVSAVCAVHLVLFLAIMLCYARYWVLDARCRELDAAYMRGSQ